jgi:hypothetical protein
MQLVLAVHADRRQTEQIAALLCKRAAVDVVQASDAGEGLQELGDRIPDLILTSPLLSPFDEGVLAEYLRELGSAAAHVQTLRIPVMTIPEPSSGGLFALRKKRKVEATPEGCDPAYFVEEIKQYLVRAAEERKTTRASADVSRAEDRVGGASESAFPIYHPDPIARHETTEPTPAAYHFDAPPSAEPVTTYHVDLGQGSDDGAPIYQPLDFARDKPLDFARDKPLDFARDKPLDFARDTPVDISRDEFVAQTPEQATPIYEPPQYATPIYEPSASDLLGREPVAPPYEQASESTPIYQPPPAPHAPLYPLPAEPVVHVFEPPTQPAQTVPPVASGDVTIESPAHAHASLVLDPSQPESVPVDPPFVVHSTEERIPLADSLERAAAELEASSLGEPMPVREVERVPLHDLSSIEEIPLPEELAARVERTAALHRSVTADPPASTSLLAAPIEIDVPPPPVAARAAGTNLRPAAEVAPEPALAPRRIEPVVEPEKPSGQKRTASFEAALAAIRKAWGRPRRATSSNLASPLSLNLNRPIEEPTVAEAIAPPPVESAAAVEPPSQAATEVDLTLDIEALDDHSSVNVVEPTVAEQVEVVTQPEDDDVYELSASPELHDLDADLDAAGPPPPVREVFPSSLLAAEEPPPVERPEADASSAPPKRDKHRKKSDKRSLKTQKPTPNAVAQPPAPPPPPQPPPPVQDEWGLFDPNQCGFAALVDKLNEVTDEKAQKPTKTTVRVISYG